MLPGGIKDTEACCQNDDVKFKFLSFRIFFVRFCPDSGFCKPFDRIRNQVNVETIVGLKKQNF